MENMASKKCAVCVAIFGSDISISLLCLFDFPYQLENWLRVQGVAPKLWLFWATGSPVNCFPLQFQISASKSTESFKSSSSWCDGSLHLFHQTAKICIHQSQLRSRRCVEWVLINSHPAIGFPRNYRHPWTFRCNRTRCGGKNLSLPVETWTQLFLFFFLALISSSPMWSSLPI